MTEDTGVAAVEITPVSLANFLTIVDQVDAGIPKLKALIAQIDANPMFVVLASKLFPGLAAFIPVLRSIGPYLDFFQ